MTAAVSRFFRSVAWAGFVSAVAGGILLALGAGGIDLKQDIAYLLELGLKPENHLYLIAVIAVLLLALGYSAIQTVAHYNRPPRAAVTRLRQALSSLQTDALDVMPTPYLAEAALAQLRELIHELQPYGRVAGSVRALVELTDMYLLELAPGIAPAGSAALGDAATLHDLARDAVEELMSVTSWAAEDEDAHG